MSTIDEIVERNARQHAIAAATGLGLTAAQRDVATLLDVVRELQRRYNELDAATKKAPPARPGSMTLTIHPCPTCGRTYP